MPWNPKWTQRVRIRPLAYYTGTSISRIYWPNKAPWDGSMISETKGFIVATGREITSDGNHDWPPPASDKKQRIRLDRGGEFYTTKCQWLRPGTSNLSITIPEVGNTGRRTYDGYWWPVSPWTLSPLVAPSTSVLNYWGTKGVAKASPTAPQAGLAQFVGELKDLPKFPILDLYRNLAKGMNPRKLIRNSGSEYLNIEFGWRPLVKDMKDFHDNTKDACRIVENFVKNSGKGVRRRRKLFEEEVKTMGTPSPLNSIGVGPSSIYLSPIAKTEREITTTTKIWFVGSFTFFIDPGPKWYNVAKRNEQVLAHLYGARIGIDTLYELTPWSWALDWVGNLGDVARNMAAFQNDGLVMHYAYLMYQVEELQSVKLKALNKGTGNIIETEALSRRFLKIRKKATPYGFGLNITDFSARQLAIIAALGMSRV